MSDEWNVKRESSMEAQGQVQLINVMFNNQFSMRNAQCRVQLINAKVRFLVL